jgi:hypothetical protein
MSTTGERLFTRGSWAEGARRPVNRVVSDAVQTAEAFSVTKAQLPITKEGHQWRMAGEDSDLSVISGSDHGIGLPFEQNCFRRDHRNFEHRYAFARRWAASTTPSIAPCMKKACSGY